mmetsp:Transcript_8534/g.14391  ORF Transcript_8534/g.14391 Transcript_8534/m.14391 type:complete len:111 (-) Transcript_8534:199-531(-)
MKIMAEIPKVEQFNSLNVNKTYYRKYKPMGRVNWETFSEIDPGNFDQLTNSTFFSKDMKDFSQRDINGNPKGLRRFVGPDHIHEYYQGQNSVHYCRFFFNLFKFEGLDLG